MYIVHTAQTLHQQRMEQITHESEILRRIAAQTPHEAVVDRVAQPHRASIWERMSGAIHRFTPHPAL